MTVSLLLLPATLWMGQPASTPLTPALPYTSFASIAGTGLKTGPGVVNDPFGVEIGPDGQLYIGEVGGHRILKLNLETHELTTVAGTGVRGYSGDGGPATAAELNEPYEIRFDAAGHLYYVERLSHTVRRIDKNTNIITTVAGNGKKGFSGDGGPATEASFDQPHSIVLDDAGFLYVADISNHRIRRVNLETGVVETIAGTGERKLPVAGQPAAGRPVLGPRALALQGQTLWVALREGHSLWKIDLTTGLWEHAAGTGKSGFQDGPADQATFNGPKGIALDAEGRVYIVDTENHAMRVYEPDTRRVATVAGAGPKARGFRDGSDPLQNWFNRPHGVGMGSDGTMYVGDSENHRVRMARPVR